MKFLLGVAAFFFAISIQSFVMAGAMVATGTKEASSLWLIPMAVVALGAGALATRYDI